MLLPALTVAVIVPLTTTSVAISGVVAVTVTVVLANAPTVTVTGVIAIAPTVAVVARAAALGLRIDPLLTALTLTICDARADVGVDAAWVRGCLFRAAAVLAPTSA